MPAPPPSSCTAPRRRTTSAISDSGAPLLWVVLRPTGAEPPYDVLAVTADPAEGEAFTEAGNDLVETVPMPDSIAEALEAFIAEHHVERPFFKRQRDRADPTRLPAAKAGGRADNERCRELRRTLVATEARDGQEADGAPSGRSDHAAASWRESQRRSGGRRARRRQRAKPPEARRSIRRACRRSSPSRPAATSAHFCNPACRPS